MSNFIDENNQDNDISISSQDSKNVISQLFIDCENVTDIFDPLYIYAPQNELDIGEFKSLCSSELLQKENIIVSENMDILYCGEQFLIGSVSFMNDEINYNKCNKCNLIIPFDMNFYSNKTNIIINKCNTKEEVDENKYNLCKLCYDQTNDIDKNLNVVKFATNIDNLRDWIHIFIIKSLYEEYGCSSSYYYYFYCNLNKNSIHYKKFAVNSYHDMLGDIFKIINESSISEIIQKYTH